MRRLAGVIAKNRQKLKELDKYFINLYGEIKEEFERANKLPQAPVGSSDDVINIVNHIKKRMSYLSKQYQTPMVIAKTDELAKLLDWINGDE